MRSIEQAEPEELHQFSVAARQHCWTNYRIEVITRQWTDLYETYSQRRRSPSRWLVNRVSPSRVRV
jgi:hypothetical protein